jgi:hypothetical protein
MRDPFSPDLVEQPRNERRLLEAEVQEKCVTHARSKEWWARKFSSPANRAVPDYIFGKAGCTVFVEFKAPGKKPTENQLEEHAKMAEAGLSVHVIDNVLAFKGLWIDLETQLAAGVYARP